MITFIKIAAAITLIVFLILTYAFCKAAGKGDRYE